MGGAIYLIWGIPGAGKTTVASAGRLTVLVFCLFLRDLDGLEKICDCLI